MGGSDYKALMFLSLTIFWDFLCITGTLADYLSMEKLEIKLPFIGTGTKCYFRGYLAINISLSQLLTRL